jgi:NAD-dependent SIR2 family protein deacetylase
LEISCPYCKRDLHSDWEWKKTKLPIEEYKEGIHIIKEGNIPIKELLWEVTCKNCNTEFTFESKDFNGYTEGKYVYNDNINCPLCKKLILRDDCSSRLITVGYKKKGE